MDSRTSLPRCAISASAIITCVLTLTLPLIATSRQAQAQMRFLAPGESPPIDAATQAAIIDSLTTGLNRGYVFADTAALMEAAVRGKLTGGAYGELTDPVLFVRQLADDFLSVYRDVHLETAVLALRDPAAEEDIADPTETAEAKERLRKSNYGFRKIEILPGNLGYLEFTQFVDAAIAGATAVAAMNVLGNVDALIIDLRMNGGGDASMIQLLTSYLIAEPTHLVSWYERETDETIQSWTQAYVPGRRLLDTPVYILTSNNTGSAAEEFTYNLRNLERATVIGDTTGGGAHTVSYLTYEFPGFRVGLKLPSGRAISPITKTNWEGVGVAPHIVVPAEQALLVAQAEALKALADSAQGEHERFRIDWARRDVEAALHPVTLSPKELSRYVGTYGPRRVFLENGVLHYERTGRPRYRLVPLGDHLFKLDGLDFFRMQFTADETGKIDRVIGIYDSGRQDVDKRTK